MERPEAQGDGDWAFLGSIRDADGTPSKWCPVLWATKLQTFHGNRRNTPQAPYFVSRDRPSAYTYAAARADFRSRQKQVGVKKEDYTGLHGLRVTGYNSTKAGLGEDLAVAQGGWRSSAHKRYDRFSLQEVVRIPSVISGHDPGNTPPGLSSHSRSVERNAGPPEVRLLRHSTTSTPEDETAENQSPAQLFLTDSSLPDGWTVETRVTNNGRRYKVYRGPDNMRAASLPQARKMHAQWLLSQEEEEDGQEAEDPSDDDSLGEEDGGGLLLDGATSSTRSPTPKPPRARPTAETVEYDSLQCSRPGCTFRSFHDGACSFELISGVSRRGEKKRLSLPGVSSSTTDA